MLHHAALCTLCCDAMRCAAAMRMRMLRCVVWGQGRHRLRASLSLPPTDASPPSPAASPAPAAPLPSDPTPLQVLFPSRRLSDSVRISQGIKAAIVQKSPLPFELRVLEALLAGARGAAAVC